MAQIDIWWYGAAIILFLLISAFFSAAETALTALSRARLYQLVMDENKRARLVSDMRKNKESLIGVILIGNNAVNIAASALATSLSIHLFADGSLLYVTAIMTVLVVMCSEILPKTYAIQNSERTALALAPPLYVIVLILSPVARVIQWIIRHVLKLFGVDITKSDTLVSATDFIRGTIEIHHREGTMIKQDRDMLGSILDLNDIEVKHIMIHRTKVDTINADQQAEVIIRQAVGMMHSRIPLWKDEPDNIIGVLYVKDIVKALNNGQMRLSHADIMELLNKPWFIPDTTNLRDQLLAFRAARRHFACVVDEYGAWQGIVTLEDIIEEIVGNIDDEHDEVAHGAIQQAGHAYYVAGSVAIRDINRQLDWDLPDEEAATIGGLIMSETKTIPSKGHQFIAHGYRFTVVDKTSTLIKRVRIEKIAGAEEEDEGVS